MKWCCCKMQRRFLFFLIFRFIIKFRIIFVVTVQKISAFITKTFNRVLVIPIFLHYKSVKINYHNLLTPLSLPLHIYSTVKQDN